MLTVHGFRYYDDYHQPQFTKIFENMDAFTKWVMDTAKSKKTIHLPAQNDDGTFNQNFATSFSSHLSFTDEIRISLADISCHIVLIKENEKILFSSGDETDKIGHISSTAKTMIKNLKNYIEKDYEFAE